MVSLVKLNEYLSPEWTHVIAAGVGLLLAGLTYLLFHFLFLTDPNSKLAAEFLRRHSIVPEGLERSVEDSDPYSHGSFVEWRTTPRRRGHSVDVLLSDAKAEVESVPGSVIDRSLTGLALAVWEEGNVEPGTIISIRPSRVSTDSAWIQVVVRRSERTGSSWVLGCEFVRQPAANVLMEFG